MLSFMGKRRVAAIEQRVADLEARLVGLTEQLQLLSTRLVAEGERAGESLRGVHRLEEVLEAREKSVAFQLGEQAQSMQALQEVIVSIQSESGEVRKLLAKIETQAQSDIQEIRRMNENLLFLLAPKV